MAVTLPKMNAGMWVSMLTMASLWQIARCQTGDLRVCVVERAPFSRCAISGRSQWEPSYLVNLFSEMVGELDDAGVKARIDEEWQCVGKTTADLVTELSRPQDSRSCDIVLSPFTITEERKQNMSFVSGVYYTYAIPLGPANDLGTGNELTFWLRPFQTSAWLLNLGLVIALGLCGGLLAMFLSKHFASDEKSTTQGWPSNLSVRSAASITSLFGQHPSHGVMYTGNPESQTKCVDVVLAAFFTAGVFVLAIISMQYAGNLAAIQTEKRVVPVYDSLADLFGAKTLTSELYASQMPYNNTVVVPKISNNDDVMDAIKQVDENRVDAFVWDALIVLYGLEKAQKDKQDICVYAMKKRVYPFELGFGVGKDISSDVVDALQRSLEALDASGRKRALRNDYLDGLNKYIGKPVCPGASQGLTPGQTAGVYVVPAVVLAAIVLFSFCILFYRKYKIWKHPKSSSSAFITNNMYPEPTFTDAHTKRVAV